MMPSCPPERHILYFLELNLDVWTSEGQTNMLLNVQSWQMHEPQSQEQLKIRNDRCLQTREGTTTEFHSSTSQTPLVDY